MKNGVRAGTAFSFSPGDGTRSDGVVLAVRGRLYDAAFHVPRSYQWMRALCTARAFNDRRWRRTAAAARHDTAHMTLEGVASPGLVERSVLEAGGGPSLLRRLRLANAQRDPPYADGRLSRRIDRRYAEPPDAACAALEIYGVPVDAAQIAALPRLRALRLTRIPHTLDLERLANPSITALSLEAVTVREFHALSHWSNLRQLELRGFWQHHPAEASFLSGFPVLRRLTIDLGGLRKNVEVYRHLDVACAWPFDLLLEAASRGRDAFDAVCEL